MATFFNLSLTSNHLHPLQVENCDSKSRLVMDEDDNGKFRLERANKDGIFGNMQLKYLLFIQDQSWSANTRH